MKKTLISLFVIGIITLFTAGAYAEWKLYDNFDSEDINTNKWDIDDSSADISIEDFLSLLLLSIFPSSAFGNT